MFQMRFDLRAPGPTPAADRYDDRYEAALDMAGWGERHGCPAVVVSQHHGSDDGRPQRLVAEPAR